MKFAFIDTEKAHMSLSRLCAFAGVSISGYTSYIWTAEGRLYLAIVVDLYSRRIVGWEARDRMKGDLAISVLKKAIAIR